MNNTECQPFAKRLLSVLFAITLVMGLVPISAYAANDESGQETTQSQEQPGAQASDNHAAENENNDSDNSDSGKGAVNSDVDSSKEPVATGDAQPAISADQTESNQNGKEQVASGLGSQYEVNAVSEELTVEIGETITIDGEYGLDHSWSSSGTGEVILKTKPLSSVYVTGVKTGEVTITHSYWEFGKKTETFTVIVTLPSAEKHITLNGNRVSKTYDGNVHEAGAATATDDGGNSVKIEYQKASGEWTTNPADITVTNVASTKVNVRASVPNVYEGYVYTTEDLEVVQRPVTLTSESHEFTYNGKAQSWNHFTYSDNLFASQVKELGCIATITNVGDEFSNEVDYTFKEGFTADNYEVKENFGTLTMKDSTAKIEVTVTGGEFTYDGKAHGATVTVGELPEGYSVKEAKSTATATDITTAEGITATADGLKIVNARDEDVTSKLNINSTSGTIKVYPCPVTLTSESHEFTYNGKAQSWNKYTCSDDLFASQVKELGCTATVTDVGDAATNTVGYTFKEGFTINNYKVTEQFGTLKVTAQSIDPADEEAYLDVQIDEPKNTVYNGEEQKWAPKVAHERGSELASTDYTVTYKRNGVVTGDFTSAGIITVVIEGQGNYTGKVEKSYTIAKRDVQFTGKSDVKVYNGSEQSIDGYLTNTDPGEDRGLVDGHTANVEAKASGTDVGTASGTITDPDDVVIKDAQNNDVSANYNITTEPGTMTIEVQSISSKDGEAYLGVEIQIPEDVVYNGKEQKLAPVVTDKHGNLLKKGTDYELSYSTDDFTNAGEVTVTIAGIGNYTGKVECAYTIEKAAIKVADSATKVYNGAEQMFYVQATDATGLAEGEVLTLNDAQVKGTEPGVYTEVSDYTWKVVKADKTDSTGNYTIEVSGTLTITAADSAAADTNNGNSDKAAKAGKGAAPQTGDTTAPFAAGAAIAAAAALVALFLSRRLRRNGTR